MIENKNIETLQTSSGAVEHIIVPYGAYQVDYDNLDEFGNELDDEGSIVKFADPEQESARVMAESVQFGPETSVIETIFEPIPEPPKFDPIPGPPKFEFKQPLQQPKKGERPMKKVSKCYPVSMKAIIGGKDVPIDSIVNLWSSNLDAALPAISKDGKRAIIKCQMVAQGITLTGDAIVLVKGKGKFLTAISEPFDIVADDGMEVVVDEAGNPVIDPETGMPQEAPAPSVAIMVAEDPA